MTRPETCPRCGGEREWRRCAHCRDAEPCDPPCEWCEDERGTYHCHHCEPRVTDSTAWSEIAQLVLVVLAVCLFIWLVTQFSGILAGGGS